MNFRARPWTFIATLALSAPVWAGPLDAAQGLLDAGKPAAAHAALRRLPVATYRHDAHFQALYGRAALGDGDPDEAVDHLQTALRLDPADDGVRLDLARAYAATGDNTGAKEQVAYLLAHTRSPAITASAQRLARGLAARPRLQWGTRDESTDLRTRTAAADSPSPASRLFANLGPDPSADLGRTLFNHGFAATAQQPLLADTFVFGDVSSFKSQRAQGLEGAGTTNVVAGTGVRWGRDRVSVPLSHREFIDDQQHYSRFDALGLEWNRRVDADNRFTVAAQRGGYALDDQTNADVASVQALLAWTRDVGGPDTAQVTGSVFLGDDSAKNESYRSLGRRFYGLTLEGRMNLFAHHTPYTSLQLKRSDYNGDKTLSLAPRREDYARLAAGWEWQILPNWGLRAEANYSLNNSTVDTYQYDRSQLFLTTRFDFR